MKTFSDCAKRWWFRYIRNAPVERVSAALLFGGGIHHAIEYWNSARICEQPAPSKDKLFSLFEQYFSTEAQKGVPIQYAKTETEAGLMAAAAAMLAVYIEFEARQPKQRILGIEEALHWESPALPVPLAGRLDLLVETPDKLVLKDYKTSKGTFTEDKLQEAAAQLGLYAEALGALAEDLGKPFAAEVVVLRKLKTPKVEVVPVPLEAADTQRIMQRLADTWRLIGGAYEQDAFPPSPSWQCTSCPYRDGCAKE
jgi:RecB family exonuclease